MLKTLPSISTAPAQAASAALSGKAIRLDPDAGTGFARLLQQQADQRLAQLRQTDQRQTQTEQHQASGTGPEPRPVATATPAPAQPTENRPATADTSAQAKPLSSAASQTVNANLARARHAALAGSRSVAADATAGGAAAMPSSRTLEDSLVVLDPVDTRSDSNPRPLPDSSLPGVAPGPAPTAPLAGGPPDPGPLAGAALSAARAAATTAGAADIDAARGSPARSTARWVAAQQRQRDPNGNTAVGQDSAVGASPVAIDPDGASSRTLTPAASARSAASPGAADRQSTAAAWAARVTAETASTDAALLPASAATATATAAVSATDRSTATPATVASTARTRPGAPGLATARTAPRFDGGPDAGDGTPGAHYAGAITAASSTRSALGVESTTPGGGPVATTALRRSETRPGRSGAGPDPSTPAEAEQAAAAAPQRPDAAAQSGLSAAPGAAVPAGTLPGQRLTPETAQAAPSPGASAGGPATAALAGGHKLTAADGTTATRRAPGLPTEAAPAPAADPLARQVEGQAASAGVPTPAQAASTAPVSGADIPAGPRRSNLGDRLATAVGEEGAANTANLASANRGAGRLDRPGSSAARRESPAQALPMATAPNAAISPSLQSAAGAEAQAHANPGDIGGTAPAVGGASTAQSTITAAGLLSTPAATAVLEARIAVPVDSPAFAPALGTQVSLFAQEGVQTARLQLNPAEMGPITVQIALDGNTARVDFQADRAATRDLIEASLPTLASAMQDAGLTLTGGGVFQQHPGRQPAPEHSPAAQAPRNATRDKHPDIGAADPAFASRRGTARGLVDLVA